MKYKISFTIFLLLLITIGFFVKNGEYIFKQNRNIETNQTFERIAAPTSTSTQNNVSTTTEVFASTTNSNTTLPIAPTLTITSTVLPSITVSYKNLPLANIRLKNESGQYVGKDISGSVGDGVTSIIIPASQFVAGTYSAEAANTDGVILAKSEPRAIPNHTEDLYLGYNNLKFPPITSVPQNVAQGLCGIVYGDVCTWGSLFLKEKPFYMYGSAQKQGTLSIFSLDNRIMTIGKTYTISFTNDPIGGRYRVYLVHRNLIGELDGVHQLHIVNVFENGMKNISLDLNEEFLDAGNNVRIAPIQSGTYELEVANIDTGLEGGVEGTVRIQSSYATPSKTNLKSYALSTPLIKSYWDGRGIFMDGGDNEDTLEMTGKRSDVVLYRGTDMPDKKQYNTVVIFRRTDNTVTVITNVEILKFDDQVVLVKDIISELH